MSNLRRFENPTEGTAPAPERLLPTRPGWWWVTLADSDTLEAVEVYDLGTGLRYMTALDSGWVGALDAEWLAPIPPPDVCAAWAANVRPSVAVLEALGTFSAALLDDISGDWKANAWRNLTDAIRAERAAQGSAPAGGDA